MKTHCNHGHEFTIANTYLYHGARHCRECVKRRGREYDAQHKIERRKTAPQRQDPEKRRMRQREAHVRHRASRNAVSRRRSQSLAGQWSALKAIAKRTHRSAAISFSEYACLRGTNKCNYCGGPLNATGSGMDRMFTSDGYEPGNCAPCCKDCNFRKGALESSRLLSPSEIYLIMLRRKAA
jgi:hypothetical protein